MFAGASVRARGESRVAWLSVTFAATAVVLRKTLNPLWFLGVGAVAGILGLVRESRPVIQNIDPPAERLQVLSIPAPGYTLSLGIS
jgi:hypothetical protein